MHSASMREKARVCGYTFETAQGERVDSMRWYEAIAFALSEHSNLRLEPEKSPTGRQLNHIVTVQRTGSVMVGYSYLRPLGVKPGQKYEVQPKKNGDILLRLID